MNSLVVFPEEVDTEGVVILSRERARALSASSHYEVGAEVRIAYLGGAKGLARVESRSTDRIVLRAVQVFPSLPLRPIDLIVGLSRPQTTKKVIQAAVMSGVRSLHLVHLESGERSYLDSHLLCPEQLRVEVAKSLEQIWEGNSPGIHVYRNLTHLFKQNDSGLLCDAQSQKIVAHPGGDNRGVLLMESMPALSSLVIAIGSEGGWSAQELTALTSQGFQQVGLGDRVVRVEIALLYLLGQTLLMNV